MTQETLQYIVFAIGIFCGVFVFSQVASRIRKDSIKEQNPWNKIYEKEEGEEDFEEIFIKEERKNIDPEDPFHRENLKKFLKIKNVRIQEKER